MDDVLVIGGGAAGMVAAWRAAALGARTRLLEKNDRLGLKIHISGGGKCNITHSGSMESLRRAFIPEEARFLRASFARFSNEALLDLIRARGVKVHARPDGRVFPDSGRAEDVVDALAWHMRQAQVVIELSAAAERLLVRDGRVEGAVARGRHCPARRVIVAVGGSSYPKTGTTGDGFQWVRELGHTVVRPRAALAPIYLDGGRRPQYSGVALRDSLLRARQGGREIARWRGDLLFTHQGVSGPSALGISRVVAQAMESGAVGLEVDILPGVPHEALGARIAALHGAGGRRTVRSLATDWLPERLVAELLTAAGVEPDTPLHRLPKSQRNRLVDSVKRWDLGDARAVPLERGEVTAGGVALDEVDPATMASRKAPGVYLCGEILDIAGPIGGYNLQAAFSTGFVAGEAAAGGTGPGDGPQYPAR